MYLHHTHVNTSVHTPVHSLLHNNNQLARLSAYTPPGWHWSRSVPRGRWRGPRVLLKINKLYWSIIWAVTLMQLAIWLATPKKSRNSDFCLPRPTILVIHGTRSSCTRSRWSIVKFDGTEHKKSSGCSLESMHRCVCVCSPSSQPRSRQIFWLVCF